MASGGNEMDSWTEDDVREFEDAIARFELACHERKDSELPDVASFVSVRPHLRLPLLIELTAIDREFRERRGEAISERLYSERFPELTQVRPDEQHDERLGDDVAAIDDSSALDLAATPAADSLTATQTYDRPRFHAEGGLGEILVVDDVQLRRRVVVKRLRARWRDDPWARRAFEQEAEITGRLEHPGIVPIHARGQTPDGRPWYSMRLVLGRTLAAALRELHREGVAPVSYDSLEFRTILAHFVAACQTVAFAHSRGVLHRDLKPANLMLGPYGETLVLDWGMAKQRDVSLESTLVSSDDANPSGAKSSGVEAWPTANPGAVLDLGQATENVSDEAPTRRLTSSSHGDGSTDDGRADDKARRARIAETHPGDVAGTPAYMSPEQARGEMNLGPATDVFGLGAILYAILTGAAPYPERRESSAERQGAIGDFTPPRQRKPSVPTELDAICRRAMATNADERYASPVALARDVENWLAGEPVAASPEGWWRKISRSLRRRPGWLAATATLAVVLPIVMGVGGWMVSQERAARDAARQTAAARSESVRQLSEFLTRAFRSADPIPFEDPGFQGAEERRSDETLRRMLDEGLELLHTRLGHAPEVRSQLLVSIGNSYVGLADYAKARQAVEESYAVRRSLYGEEGGPTLECRHLLARIAHAEGEYERAERMYREVIAARERLAPAVPLLVAETQYHLAWLLFHQPLGLGNPQFEPDRVRESMRLFEVVLATRERHLPPQDRGIGLALAGLAAAQLCLPDEIASASSNSARAVEIFRGSRQENLLGSTLVEYGEAEALRRLGRLHEADDLYVRILDRVRAHLGPRHPIVVLHLWNMAGLYRKMGDSTRAQRVVSEIRERLRSLPGIRSAPANLDGLAQFGDALRDVDAERAREVYREALQYARERPEPNRDMIDRIERSLASL